MFTLFVLGTKIAFAVGIALADKCISTCTCNCYCNSTTLLKVIRNYFAFIFCVLDFFFAIGLVSVLVISQYDEEDPLTPKLFWDFIKRHGTQVLLILGTFGTSLLLPLEDFVQRKDNNSREPFECATNYGSINENEA